MSELSVVVLTKNEERHLPGCLASVRWADEVIVLDSFSSDRTVEIARSFGAAVHQRPFRDYADQRNAGIALASAPWLLYVDADERVTPALADEIEREVQMAGAEGGEPQQMVRPVGYWIPRHNYLFGRLVKHAGWFPDYQLRLFRRDRAQYDPARGVHELVVLSGLAGALANPLIHYNYDTVAEFVRKQHAYSAQDAAALFRQGVRVRPHHFVLQPLREFRRRFISLDGYRDGWMGLLLSLLMAYNEVVKYAKLRQLQVSQDSGARTLA